MTGLLIHPFGHNPKIRSGGVYDVELVSDYMSAVADQDTEWQNELMYSNPDGFGVDDITALIKKTATNKNAEVFFFNVSDTTQPVTGFHDYKDSDPKCEMNAAVLVVIVAKDRSWNIQMVVYLEAVFARGYRDDDSEYFADNVDFMYVQVGYEYQHDEAFKAMKRHMSGATRKVLKPMQVAA